MRLSLAHAVAALSLLVLATLAACDPTIHDYESNVVHRAAIEFGCAESAVSVSQIDRYTYLATGCGCQATYDSVYTVYSCDRAPNLHADACMTHDGGPS